MLLGRPGELITREEIQQKLWPSGTFVDFENGLNSAVNRLRDALGDSADEPKFIETVPRRGYRFLVPVERVHAAAPSPAAPTPEAVPIQHSAKRWFWLAASVATALVLAVLVGWRLHASPKKVLNFAQRDWVLITNFENHTGNPVLDGTLEYALERELSNSQFVNVVPRERIGDVLKLMRKPLDTKIDAVLGREVCLRDGGIRALLTGRVEKLGTTYVLSTELVNPANGVAVASLSEEDPADSQMAASVRRLSNRVRETLGEKTAQIQQGNERLEKVTTPSLHALQLYSKADELMRAPSDSEDADVARQAAELLKQALADDPNFASAHLLLAYTYANREDHWDNPKCSSQMHKDARLEFQRAFDLANTTSDRERLFILASYYHFGKDTGKAIETYEALLRLYPDHFWAANNLEGLYLRGGRRDDFWRLAVRVADLRPDDFDHNRGAACGKYSERDPDGAKPYMERAIAAADPKDPFNANSVELLPVFYSWAEGDVALAHHRLQEIEGAQKPPFSSPDFFFHMALGETSEAEHGLHTGPRTELDRKWGEAVVEFVKGDLQAAKKNLAAINDEIFDGTGMAAVLLGRCGLWDKVDRIIRKRGPDSRGTEIVRGERALSHGQVKEGIALLEKGLEAMHNFPTGAFYLGSETLARSYEKQGNRDDALRVLQRASNAKGKAINCFSGGTMYGVWWLRIELQLADLYREMGRVPEAEQVENELRKMLIYADTDHPILHELQKRNHSAAVASTKSAD